MKLFKRKPSALDERIAERLDDMNTNRYSPDQYEACLKAVERLYKLKAQDASRQVSPDTALLVAAHLTGIGLIIRHEQFNVITSKALSFVPKLK